MGTPNRQIGWSQEASLLSVISKQLEQLGALIFAATSGGGSTGGLKTFDDTPVTSTMKRISDGAGNLSGLYISTTGITNYAGQPPANLNTAFGEIALKSLNASAQYNNAFGSYSLQALVNSIHNVAVGTSAMYSYNDADGSGTRGQNVAVGNFAFYTGVSGKWNTIVGTSCYQNGAGSFNTAMGAHTGEGSTGSWNIFMGVYAGSNCSGSNNILINTHGGGGGVSTGNFNTIINPRAHSGITTGSNNTIIGGYPTNVPNGSDQIFIGTGAGATRIQFDSSGNMFLPTALPAGTGAATEKMMVRDTAAGAIKQVDIVVTNATASALSAATLNSTYPSATLGFRVICMSIGGGALIYTKTGASTWASSPATAVA